VCVCVGVMRVYVQSACIGGFVYACEMHQTKKGVCVRQTISGLSRLRSRKPKLIFLIVF